MSGQIQPSLLHIDWEAAFAPNFQRTMNFVTICPWLQPKTNWHTDSSV
jgi:hypothetical protein